MPIRDVLKAEYGIVPDLKTLVELRHYGKGIKFPPQRRVAGSLTGGYLSNIRGRGIDFDEVRQYNPGDDIRNMDWRVTARMNKPHTKVFKEERERPVFFAIDNSQSMQFGTRRVFKSVAAAEAATMLAWAASSNNDRIGGLVFSEKNHIELKPTQGDRGVLRMINALCRSDNNFVAEENDGYMQQALQRLRYVAKPGSAIFLLSDFFAVNENSHEQLQQLATHNELHLIHVFDQVEYDVPPSGRYNISDGINITELDLEGEQNRISYRNLFSSRQNDLIDFCKKRRIGYMPLSTQTNPYQLAQAFAPHAFLAREVNR
ncbi:MAG: DUF58 domain-containing protein [Gammaproteobacteria bacterium]|nr:MAG: DUF58 domain-containing protein [Gammaproteobacteria bacterium]